MPFIFMSVHINTKSCVSANEASRDFECLFSFYVEYLCCFKVFAFLVLFLFAKVLSVCLFVCLSACLYADHFNLFFKVTHCPFIDDGFMTLLVVFHFYLFTIKALTRVNLLQCYWFESHNSSQIAALCCHAVKHSM